MGCRATVSIFAPCTIGAVVVACFCFLAHELAPARARMTKAKVSAYFIDGLSVFRTLAIDWWFPPMSQDECLNIFQSSRGQQDVCIGNVMVVASRQDVGAGAHQGQLSSQYLRNSCEPFTIAILHYAQNFTSLRDSWSDDLQALSGSNKLLISTHDFKTDLIGKLLLIGYGNGLGRARLVNSGFASSIKNIESDRSAHGVVRTASHGTEATHPEASDGLHPREHLITRSAHLPGIHS